MLSTRKFLFSSGRGSILVGLIIVSTVDEMFTGNIY